MRDSAALRPLLDAYTYLAGSEHLFRLLKNNIFFVPGLSESSLFF